MTSIYTLFEQTQLSEAAYSQLLAFPDSPRGALENEGFSGEQAEQFLANWSIAHHYTSPPGLFGITDGTGFSATLFKVLDTQHYVRAIRGTEIGFAVGYADLLAADFGDIVLDGLAMDQIVDLYNYWQSLTHAGIYRAAELKADSAATAKLAASMLNGRYAIVLDEVLRTGALVDMTPVGLQVRRIEFGNSDVLLANTDIALGSGVFPNGAHLDVTGHSLGGHLTDAFTRLFPGIATEVTTINGAGYPTGLLPGLSLNASANIHNLFDRLGGNASFDEGLLLNIHGDGPDFVTMNSRFGLVQPGAHWEIYIESMDAAHGFGHGSPQMTDMLAVYGLLSTLVPQPKPASKENLQRLGAWLKASIDRSSSTTLNAVRDGLYKLLLHTNPRFVTNPG